MSATITPDPVATAKRGRATRSKANSEQSDRPPEPADDAPQCESAGPSGGRRQRLVQIKLDGPLAAEGLEIAVANAGDHASIHRCLTAVFQGPSHDVFLASLDDPFYEPCDRMVARRGHQVVSHVHLTRRTLRLGPLAYPASGLCWLATLQEFRGRGVAGALVELAQRAMLEDGTSITLLRTRIPHYFRRFGWAVCGRHSFSRASTRDLLSELAGAGQTRRERRLSVRPWRQVELPALLRLYRQSGSEGHGMLDRSEAYWRWLISGRSFDQIFVAVEGPEQADADETGAPIVGYAVTRDDEIVELAIEPGRLDAARALLARACRDLIERDHHAIVYHGAPDDPVHGVFRQAGGAHVYHEAHQGEVFMVKLLDPDAMLQSLRGELYRRAQQAGVPASSEVGLAVEGRRWQLLLTRRSVKIAAGRLGRSYLRMNMAELTRLLLGHVDLDEAIAGGRVTASTRLAAETARALFPRLPLWRPPLDDLAILG